MGTTEGKAPQHLPGFCCHKQQADGQQRHGGGTAVGRVVLARLPGALPWPQAWLQVCPGGLAVPAAQRRQIWGKPWRCIGAALPSLIGRLDFTRANQAAGQ